MNLKSIFKSSGIVIWAPATVWLKLDDSFRRLTSPGITSICFDAAVQGGPSMVTAVQPGASIHVAAMSAAMTCAIAGGTDDCTNSVNSWGLSLVTSRAASMLKAAQPDLDPLRHISTRGVDSYWHFDGRAAI